MVKKSIQSASIQDIIMSQSFEHFRYPNYPRDSAGIIPEPMACDVLRIMAEIGGGYLWDMNGMSISVSSLTDRDGEELAFLKELDEQFCAWQDRYDSKPLDANHDLVWDSEDEQSTFDSEGLVLAQKLHDYFKGTKTVLYCSTRGNRTQFDARNTPSIS